MIVDTSFGKNRRLKARVEYVTPAEDWKWLRVRWGVGSPPRGYRKEGGGVVFVANQSDSPPPADENPSIRYVDERYEFSEGLADADWLMLVMILPKGYVLNTPEPAPDGSRLLGDRMAVYWRLSKRPGPPVAEVTWSLRPEQDLRTAFQDVEPGAPLPFDSGEPAPDFEVFLSYRRQHDQWAVGRISDWLKNSFQRRVNFFRDSESIRSGRDFREEIDAAVGQCKVILVVIGPKWLDPPKPRGKRRIDSKNDWVRIEIESALQRHRIVMPVLLDNARMPDAKVLPKSLRELAFRQGLTLRYSTFETEVQRLVDELRGHGVGSDRQ